MRPLQVSAASIRRDQMNYSRTVADSELDITNELCPMTFVRTRLALDRLRPGQTLGVTLRGDEAARNVPAAALQLGYAILAQDSRQDGSVRLVIEKR